MRYGLNNYDTLRPQFKGKRRVGGAYASIGNVAGNSHRSRCAACGDAVRFEHDPIDQDRCRHGAGIRCIGVSRQADMRMPQLARLAVG